MNDLFASDPTVGSLGDHGEEDAWSQGSWQQDDEPPPCLAPTDAAGLLHESERDAGAGAGAGADAVAAAAAAATGAARGNNEDSSIVPFDCLDMCADPARVRFPNSRDLYAATWSSHQQRTLLEAPAAAAACALFSPIDPWQYVRVQQVVKRDLAALTATLRHEAKVRAEQAQAQMKRQRCETFEPVRSWQFDQLPLVLRRHMLRFCDVRTTLRLVLRVTKGHGPLFRSCAHWPMFYERLFVNVIYNVWRDARLREKAEARDNLPMVVHPNARDAAYALELDQMSEVDGPKRDIELGSLSGAIHGWKRVRLLADLFPDVTSVCPLLDRPSGCHPWYFPIDLGESFVVQRYRPAPAVTSLAISMPQVRLFSIAPCKLHARRAHVCFVPDDACACVCARMQVHCQPMVQFTCIARAFPALEVLTIWCTWASGEQLTWTGVLDWVESRSAPRLVYLRVSQPWFKCRDQAEVDRLRARVLRIRQELGVHCLLMHGLHA